MTDPTAIASAAIEWALASAEHWALVQEVYHDTGLPSKRDYRDVTAAGKRVDDLQRRLYALALAASDRAPARPMRQAAMALEVGA